MNNRREPTTTVGGPFRWTAYCDECEANIRMDVPTHIVEGAQKIFPAGLPELRRLRHDERRTHFPRR
jgi:hypothetical protein